MGAWTVIDEQAGLWALESFNKGGFSLRTTALCLRDGGVLLASPTRGLGDAAHEELAALGTPSLLLAPNHFHHLGLGEHRERYPEARVVASAVAAPRLRKKTGFDVATLDEARARLPDGVGIVEPAGTRSGETWLSVSTARGTAWVVSDAFFNLPSLPRNMFGLALRATGTGPGLRIGRTYTALAVGDKRAYGAWLSGMLDRSPPSLLVPGHGDVLEGPDLAERLRALAAARLGAPG